MVYCRRTGAEEDYQPKVCAADNITLYWMSFDNELAC